MEINNQSICILGAGREGKATAAYLRTTYPEATLTIADEQEVDFTMERVATRFGEEYPISLEEWDVVVVSPGIHPKTPLLETAEHITTATNIFLHDCRGMTMGVTGSKGKSTTASVLHAVFMEAGLQAHLCGNIGIPALEVLAKHNTEEDIFIVEMSSYQTSRLDGQAPDISVVTSLFPDHIDYHGGKNQYYLDKLKIVTMQREDQLAVFNQNNPDLKERMEFISDNNLAYPSKEYAHVRDGVVMYADERVMAVKDIPLLGEHNVENILGVVSVAKEFGIDNEAIGRAVMHFKSLPHRLQNIGEFNGVTFYDDSISTTPESAVAAIRAVPNVQTLILGGQDRGYEFTLLAEEITKHKIPNIVLFPDSGSQIKAALEAAEYTSQQLLETSSLEKAAAFAFEHTEKQHACILSPASPSYNLFKNFEDRGDQFKKAVQNASS